MQIWYRDPGLIRKSFIGMEQTFKCRLLLESIVTTQSLKSLNKNPFLEQVRKSPYKLNQLLPRGTCDIFSDAGKSLWDCQRFIITYEGTGTEVEKWRDEGCFCDEKT